MHRTSTLPRTDFCHMSVSRATAPEAGKSCEDLCFDAWPEAAYHQDLFDAKPRKVCQGIMIESASSSLCVSSLDGATDISAHFHVAQKYRTYQKIALGRKAASRGLSPN